MEFRDRVKQTTATTGTGAYTISALAVPGFTTVAASFSDGAIVPYCCTDNIDYEVGIGTYTALSNSLSRDTILRSSNSDAAVDWGAGTKDIYCVLPAAALPAHSASDPTVSTNPKFVGARHLNTATGDEWICVDNTPGANKWACGVKRIPAISSDAILNYDFTTYTSGTVVDLAGNYDGTVSGALATTDGLYFDGSNDYVTTTLSGTDFPTAAVTIRATGVSYDYDAHRGLCGIDQNDTGSPLALFYFKAADTNKKTPFMSTGVYNPQQNGFQFDLVGVFSSATARLFSNGKKLHEVSSGFLGSGIPSGPLYVGCGMYNRSKADYFIGLIRSFTIWDRALSENEVAALIAGG